MTDYILKVNRWATHWWGHVDGPHPASCHGNLTFNAPHARGKYTCALGHVIPDQVHWDVDADWSPERFDRYAARHFEGAGPAQFGTAAELVDTAVKRFRGEIEAREFLNECVPGQPGDRLYLDYVARKPEELDEEWGRINGTQPFGSLLAEIKDETE